MKNCIFFVATGCDLVSKTPKLDTALTQYIKRFRFRLGSMDGVEVEGVKLRHKRVPKGALV